MNATRYHNDPDWQAFLRKEKNAADPDMAYKQLFDALAEPPPVDLPYGFPETVLRQIRQTEACRHERNAYVMLGCCILLIVGVTAGVLAGHVPLKAIRYAYVIGPAILVPVFVAVSYWLDYRLIKNKTT